MTLSHISIIIGMSENQDLKFNINILRDVLWLRHSTAFISAERSHQL